MEYLMTYGWAILIIAVVLGVLFQLGVFSSASLVPRAQPGNCRIMRLAGEANPEGVCQGEMPEFVGQFNGQSGSKINAGSGTSLNVNVITISFWADGVSSQSSFTGIIDRQTSGNLQGYAIKLDSSTNHGYYFELGTGSSYADFDMISSTSIDNTWHYIAFTYDGNNVKGYFDSALKYSGTENTFITSTTPTFYISVGGFNGMISNVQVYNTTLDANQVAALYQEGIGGAPVDPYHIMGWWPLNGDAKDYSGNNNVGTPTNVVYNSQWTSSYTPP